MASRSIPAIFMWLLILSAGRNTLAQTYDLNGQLSGWVLVKPDESYETLVGFRYIPELSIQQRIAESYSVDTLLSVNAYGFGVIHPSETDGTDGDVKPYRIWLRFSSSQFEMRAGLQKITFGPAKLLRPLMWFDRTDPRDPLKLTDGVYGLLGRYFFLSNANVWLWGLFGNDDKKGWETDASNKERVEYGGRLQFPMLGGEIAGSYHHREIDLTNPDAGHLLSFVYDIPEDRFGIDGRWDAGIGLWFESALIHQQHVENPDIRYQSFFCFGIDYTFDWGNGIHFIGEHLTFGFSEKAFGSITDNAVSALSLNYPISLLDDLTAMLYYDHSNFNMYRLITWQRTYDNWGFYIIGFWNPNQSDPIQLRQSENLFAGKGVQVMIVFNH